MKILVILPGSLPFPPLLGGATEKLVSYYIDENEKTGNHQYTVISPYDKRCNDRNYKHTNIIYLKQSSLIFRASKAFRYILRHVLKVRIPNAYLSKIMNTIKSCDYDKVIIENNPEYGYYLRKKTKKNNIILHLHNDSINRQNIEYARAYKTILVVSNYLKRKINSLDKKLDIKVLYNAINIEAYKKNYDITEIKSSYGISLTKKIVMYVGRLQEDKGVLDVIKAFKKCINNKDMQLILVGSTFFNTNIKNTFSKTIKEEIEKNTNIIMTGYIDDNKVPAIMQCANIGVIPSKCNEAFGLTLLEFMASGVPTIITNDGALPEIGNDKTSIIVNKQNNYDNSDEIQKAMSRLLYNTSKDDLRKIKTASIKTAQQYSIDAYITLFNKYINT